MKKKLFLVLITALTALVLAGCVRMDINVTINKDGTVDVSMLEAVSSDLAGGYELISGDDLSEFEAEGATCTPYDEDGYIGYTITQSGIQVSDLLEGSESLGSLGDSFSLTKDSGKYILDLDLFADTDTENLSYLSSINAYGGYMTFTLTLPSKPIAHNADSVSEDGLTLTWDLTRMSAGDTIHVEFKLPNPYFVPIVVGISAAIVVIAAVILFLLLRRRKTYAPPPSAPFGGAAPFDNSAPWGGSAPSAPFGSSGSAGARFCPNCGSPASGRFCPKCGTDLSQLH